MGNQPEAVSFCLSNIQSNHKLDSTIIFFISYHKCGLISFRGIGSPFENTAIFSFFQVSLLSHYTLSIVHQNEADSNVFSVSLHESSRISNKMSRWNKLVALLLFVVDSNVFNDKLNFKLCHFFVKCATVAISQLISMQCIACHLPKPIRFSLSFIFLMMPFFEWIFSSVLFHCVHIAQWSTRCTR